MAIADDLDTWTVIEHAIARIGQGRAQVAHEQIEHIYKYLVEQHWFHTAGDLRVALYTPNEWSMLELPSRLKIALQEVLEEQEANGMEAQTETTSYADGDTSGYDEGQYYTEDTPAGYWSASTYAFDDPNATDTSPTPEPPLFDDVGHPEATTVPTLSTWSCRQCTFINPVEESFCEMCYDHISLSPDWQAITKHELPDAGAGPPNDGQDDTRSSDTREAASTGADRVAPSTNASSLISYPVVPSAPPLEEEDCVPQPSGQLHHALDLARSIEPASCKLNHPAPRGSVPFGGLLQRMQPTRTLHALDVESPVSKSKEKKWTASTNAPVSFIPLPLPMVPPVSSTSCPEPKPVSASSKPTPLPPPVSLIDFAGLAFHRPTKQATTAPPAPAEKEDSIQPPKPISNPIRAAGFIPSSIRHV